MNSTSKEELENAMQMSMVNLGRSLEKVNSGIDDLTSASLKRVLKAITFSHVSEEAQSGKKLELNEQEQNLVDRIFQLQEDTLGHLQLTEELRNKELDSE